MYIFSHFQKMGNNQIQSSLNSKGGYFHKISKIKAEWIQKNKNYFKSKLKQNELAIKRYFQELRQKDQSNCSEANINFSHIFQQFSLNIPFSPYINQIIRIIQEKKIKYFANMPQQQKNFYLSIIDENQQFRQVFQPEKWKIIKKCTKKSLQKMFRIDLLSYCLKENKEFKQNCKNNAAKLITYKRMNEITGIEIEEIKRLQQFYKKNSNLVRYSFSQQMKELITIFSLLKIQSRINTLIKKDKKQSSQVIFNQILKEESQEQQENCLSENQIMQKQKYNLSELEGLQIQNEQKKISIALEEEFTNFIRKMVNETNDSIKKRRLLCIKSKYNLSFAAIFRFIKGLKTNNKSMMEALFFQEEDYEEAQILAMRQLVDYVLPIHSSQQVLNTIISNTQRGLDPQLFKNIIKRPQFKGHILETITERFKLLTQILQSQILLQTSAQQMLIINKFEFSYDQLKEKQANSEQDLVLTMILGTNKSQIVLCTLHRQILKESIYLGMLKTIIEKVNIKRPFTVVLNEYFYSRGLDERQYYRKALIIKQQLDSRLYITNSPHFSRLNYFLYAYIKQQLTYLAQKLQPHTFYDIIEAEIKSRIQIFQKYLST